ncbi:hypothetical protein BH09VER1_BH09VER1_41770 [soil metagenome]
MRTRREQERYERRKVFWAAVVSTLFHVLLILLIAIILKRTFVPPPPPPPEPEPVVLTMVDPMPTPPPLNPSYIETTDSQKAEKPPEKPTFESDKDTHAASQAPATGNEPLPSQDGEKSPAMSFENKEYTAGPTPRPSSPSAPPQQVTPPTPEPVPTPEPMPTPEATPSATPPPRNNSDVALLEPPKPRNTPRPEMQKTVPRPPAPPAQPGYQPQTQITRIQGGISTRGRSAVDAIGTPLGRYKKAMSDAIGSRWYFYVNEHRDMLSGGTVDLRFVVSATGKTQRIKVLRNTSNGTTENLSVGAVQDAEIPPIPKELVPQLQNGSIEVEFSFTILSD